MTSSSRWLAPLREPLIQFLIIGAMLFALDHVLSVQRDDPNNIFIDADRVAWLVSVFQQGQGRVPVAEEVENLIVKWSQNEVFYREAQALGLDQGDEMMRSRLILKMRNILFNRIVQEPPSDAELRDWFELNRDKYDVPARYTFEQFPLAKESLAETAQQLATDLGDGEAPQQWQAQLRQYPRRPVSNMRALFGESDSDRLVAAPLGHWQAVVSHKGWHLARVTEVHDPIPAQLEDVQTRVSKAFMEVSADMQLVEMAGEIAEKYQLHREFNADDLAIILASAQENRPAETTADSRTMKARAGVSNDEQVN